LEKLRKFIISGPPEKQELSISNERALEKFDQMYRVATHRVKHALPSEIDKAIAKYEKAYTKAKRKANEEKQNS